MIAFLFAFLLASGGGIPTGDYRYSVSLLDAEHQSSCPYSYELNYNEFRIPKYVEVVRCYSAGRNCLYSEDRISTCMELKAAISVTYVNSGNTRNESFPVACACVMRHPKKATSLSINTVD